MDKYYIMANGGNTFNVGKILFLINDTNGEILQHFTQKYISNKDFDETVKIIQCKNNLCHDEKIKYFFGILPDKSFCLSNIILNDMNLDVEPNRYFVDVLYKNLKKITFVFIDFFKEYHDKNILNYFYSSDSHVNDEGLLLYAKCISKLLKIDFNCSYTKNIVEYEGDLILHGNYNIGDINKNNFVEKTVKIKIENPFIFLKLPIEYNTTFKRKNHYICNINSNNKLTVIFLCDSSIFNNWEIFASLFYISIFIWDHLYFPDKFISKINPNFVFELRTERFMTNYVYKKYCDYINDVSNVKLSNEFNEIDDYIVLIFYLINYNGCVNNEDYEKQECIVFIKKLLIKNNDLKQLNLFSRIFYNFDHIKYSNNHKDLNEKYEYNKFELYKHYYLFGYNENRNIT